MYVLEQVVRCVTEYEMRYADDKSNWTYQDSIFRVDDLPPERVDFLIIR